ncbi:MAG: hypothetical protein ABI441_10935 [Flavobacterium sp.]
MKIKFTVPKKWNDLTEWQFSAIGRYMFNSRNEKTDTRLFKISIMGILLVPKFSIKNIIKSLIFFSIVPYSQFEQYTDFIFDEKDLFTRFPLKIKVGYWPSRKVLYGPLPRMANSTIEELSYADTFFYKWSIGHDIDDLHRLVAVLYRPNNHKDNPEDKRSDFSSLTLEENSKLTDKIPQHVKFMLAHVYAGCRQNFINRNKNVFPSPVSKAEENENKTKKNKPYLPFSKIIDSFAMDEVQIFGNHQQVEKVYASKFLSLYDASIVQQRERESRNKK